MDTRFAITEYPDAAVLTAQLDALIKKPIYSINRTALKKYEEEYFEKKCAKSKEMITEAREVIPGGVQHNLAFNYPFPIVMTKAKGNRLWDIDGNEYFDFLQAGGPTIIGSNDDVVKEKVKELLDDCGPSTGLFHPYEYKLAKKISECVPSVEMFRMLGSGTEACMCAVRVARLATGHKNIIKMGGAYHGWSDQLAWGMRVPGTLNLQSHGVPMFVFKHTQEFFPNDLKDLEMLLKQTEGLGINVYTHGEMLPSHGYEGLKKYKHLAGNFGGAWQDQQKQFDNLPGCILMTTNCLMRPRDTYKDRIYSTNVVGWDGIKYIEKKPDGEKDFSEIIKQSLELGGFTEEQEAKEILVGFGHEAALSHAVELVEAVKSKQIRHFFLIGGCDGARPGRSYFTDFATMVPDDCMILTLACGKYRFNKLDFGTVAGLPRLLDIGQCNDVYSAILIANALSDAFGTDVNGLPLSLIVSWYEQKAVADLLALLSLGIKNIYLGPTLPAFLSPNVLQYLVDTFQLRLISNPEDDIKTCLGQAV